MNSTLGKPEIDRRVVLALLTLIYMFNTMDRHIVFVLAEPIRLDLKLSDTQLGLVSGLAFALFYTFFGVPVGWLADRFGRVKVIAVACTVWSLCSAAGALAQNFYHLALARMGVGMGEAGGAAPSYSLISARYRPEERGSALGILHLGSPIGTFLSAALCGWIAARYGWRAALVAVSLPGVIFGFLLLAVVKEPARELPEGGAAAQPSLPSSIKAFFKDPLLRLLGITAGLSSFSSFGIAAWLPSFLMRVKGMTLDEMALYFGLPYALAFGLGLWLPGVLADRMAKRTRRAYALVPMSGLLLAAPSLALAIVMPGWALSLAVFLLPLMLTQFFLAPMLALLQNETPENRRTTYSALFLFLNNLVGAGLGPLYVGMISDGFKQAHGDQSLAYGLIALVPVMLVAAACHFTISRKLSAKHVTS